MNVELKTRSFAFSDPGLKREQNKVDLVASEDSRVLVIPREEFDRLLIRLLKLGRRLLKRLVTHFARSESI